MRQSNSKQLCMKNLEQLRMATLFPLVSMYDSRHVHAPRRFENQLYHYKVLQFLNIHLPLLCCPFAGYLTKSVFLA